MKKYVIALAAFLFTLAGCSNKSTANSDGNISPKADTLFVVQSGSVIPTDTFSVSSSDKSIYVTLVGHGSVMLEYTGKIIHIDPFSNVADYSKLPKADLILLTHEHFDHLDTTAIAAVKKGDTDFIVSKVCNEMLGYGSVVNNGDTTTWEGIRIDVVPAYNIVNKKSANEFWHPKGRGNGYVLTLGETRIYVSGDTENIPEMDKLKGTIDIAFLSKNMPYTMNDDMFVDAANKVSSKVLYPYHMAEFDEAKISKAIANSNIELRVRPMSNK